MHTANEDRSNVFKARRNQERDATISLIDVCVGHSGEPNDWTAIRRMFLLG